jgi:Prokaryotic homologs of the JAB domain
VRIRLPADQTEKLSVALKRAGTREIGGQLFGEQLAPSQFLVSELTIQTRPGTFARFVVDLIEAVRDAMHFFERTGHNYTRFNYIGEWHSHPSFAVQPSGTDVATMRALVSDGEFRGSFAVLMIVRLDQGAIAAGAWVFDPQGTELEITLEMSVECK